MKNFLIILFSLVYYNLSSQVNSVPLCHTSQNPNLETSMQSLNALIDCQLAYDTTAHLVYKFIDTNPIGTRWVLVGNSLDAWLVGGNSNGIDEVFGTNDNFDVILETNNIPFGRFYAQDQSVAFGNYTSAASPFSNLYVVGTPSHITGNFNMNGQVGAGGLGFYLNSGTDRYIQALPNSNRMLLGMLDNGTSRVDIGIRGSLEDADGDKGTIGQILSSGVDDTDWVDITLGKKITELSDSTWMICDSLYIGGIFVSEKCDTLKTCCGKQGNFRVYNYYTNPAGDAVVYLEHTNSDGTIQTDSVVFPNATINVGADDLVWVNDANEHGQDPDFKFGHVSGSRTLIAGGAGLGSTTGNFSAIFGSGHSTASNFSIVAGENNFADRHYNAIFGRNNTGDRYDLIGGLGNTSDNGYTIINGINNTMSGQYGGLITGEGNTVTNARYSSTLGSNNTITSSWRSFSVGGNNSIISTSPNNYQLGSSNSITLGSYSAQIGQVNVANGSFTYQLGSDNVSTGSGTTKFMVGKNNDDNRAGTTATSFTLGRNNIMGALAADGLIVGDGNNLNVGSSAIIGQGNDLDNGSQANFIIGKDINPSTGLANNDRTFVNFLRLWDLPATVSSSSLVLVRDPSEEGEIKEISTVDLGIPSSINFKEDIIPVGDELIEWLENIEVSYWRYKDDKNRHIGPMAEDFNKLKLSSSEQEIKMSDAIGVLMGVTKQQQRKIKLLEKKINDNEIRNVVLEISGDHTNDFSLPATKKAVAEVIKSGVTNPDEIKRRAIELLK